MKTFLLTIFFGAFAIAAGAIFAKVYLLHTSSIFYSFEPSHLPRTFLAQVTPGPNEAVFLLSPKEGSFSLDSTFPLQVKISASQGVTSTKAYLDFNPAILSVATMNRQGSVFSNWWEESFDNTSGKIRLQASTPIPGFQGNNGFIVTLTFRVLSAGTTDITYDQTSLALRPDDINILNLSASEKARFVITVPTPPPSPPPSGGGGGGGGGASPTSPPPASPTPVPIIGDCNSDGKVNIFDLSILLSHWKKTTTVCDLSRDGKIDLFDLSILLSNWTKK